MTLHGKIPLGKEMYSTQITALCTLCPIVRKIANYVQNYGHAYLHNPTITSQTCQKSPS